MDDMTQTVSTEDATTSTEDAEHSSADHTPSNATASEDAQTAYTAATMAEIEPTDEDEYTIGASVTPDGDDPKPSETISFDSHYEIVVGTVWMREFGQPRDEACEMYKAIVTPTEQAPEDTTSSAECIDTAPVDAVAGALYELQSDSEGL